MTKCAAITQKGLPCSRIPQNGKYCRQHARAEFQELPTGMTKLCINHTKVKVKTGEGGKQVADIGTTQRTCLDVPTALVNNGAFDVTSLSETFTNLNLEPGPKLII
jgi:hypothetical protein